MVPVPRPPDPIPMPFYRQDGMRLDNGTKIGRAGGVGQKCLVCGDPNSNCASGENMHPKISFADRAKPTENMVYVEEDVYREQQLLPGTFTKIRLARAGTYITQERAEEIGLKAR